MDTTSPGPARATPVVVAGHICLDLIPRLPADPRRRALRAGALDLVGPITPAIGGAVGNTGVALHRLGLRTTLVARVGDDPLGGVLAGLVRSVVPAERVLLRAVPGQATSASVVLNRPGEDRAIAHFIGVNDTFVAADVPEDVLEGAGLLHVGYPPLMAALVADDGRELASLLRRAREAGAMTSLDMANANLGARGGVGAEADQGAAVRWRPLLRRVLPDVDVFLPSLAEAAHLLGRRAPRASAATPPLAAAADLAGAFLDLGVAIAGIKLGEHGLYVRTAPGSRVATVPRGRLDPPAWAGRELHSAVFEVEVAGTAGAGDTTIAGFLFGLLAGWSPEDAVTAACAVGGSSTEAVDGTSAVPPWPSIKRRLAAGWRRRAPVPVEGWRAPGEGGLGVADGGLRSGPRDRG